MDKPKNIAEIIEKQRLGYNVPKQVDVAYNKLKCLSGELNFFHDAQEERVYCPVFASKFCHNKGHENLLVTANEDGKIVLLDVNQRPEKKIMSSFQAHDNAIFDLAWTNDDMKFISASGDHSATLWQIAEGDVKPICQYHGHQHSVKAISCRPDDHAVFSTGGRDGALLIWDRRMSSSALVVSPDKIIRHSHEAPGFFKARRGGSQTNSVTGLVFQDDNNLISCSAGDGLIKVWDMRKTYCINKLKRLPVPKYVLRYSGQGRNGFSSLAISPCRLRLYANCIDNYIYCYDIGTYSEKPLAHYGGHVVSSFYIKNSVSPDGRYIASGSNDNKAYIWSVGSKQTSPLVTLNGHAAEVTGIDWCKAGHLKMVTCSDDATFRVWKLHPQHYSHSDPQLRGWAEEHVDLDIQKSEPSRKRKYNYYAMSCPSSGDISQKENTRPVELQVKKKLCPENSIDKSILIGDLPNLVIDGTSPHIHHCSPTPKPKDNWLNQLKPKIIDVNCKSPQGSNRKKHNSNNMSPVRGSILRFFKVSSRPPTCETQANIPSTDSQTTISSAQA